MRIEITAIVEDTICDNDNPRSWRWQQATYTVDGVAGPGLLSRYLDASEMPRYTDDQAWDVRHDARCVANGRKPQLDYVDDEGDERIDAAEAAILAAWSRWDDAQR